MLANVWQYLNINAGGITTIATIVLAFAAVVLAVLTGWYAVITARQAKHVREQASELANQSGVMKQQAEELRRQDQQRVRRAIQAVVAEINVNDQCAGSNIPTPFLCEAYPADLWALDEIDMSNETRSAIASAHLSVKRFNLEYVGDATGAVRTGRSTRAWELATSEVSAALQAISSDEAVQRFLARTAHPDRDSSGQP